MLRINLRKIRVELRTVEPIPETVEIQEEVPVAVLTRRLLVTIQERQREQSQPVQMTEKK